MKTAMKLFTGLLTIAIVSCAANEPQAKSENFTQCQDPRPQICTMEYIPVCAVNNEGETKTYATGCTACSDTNVTQYSAGECTE